MSLKACAFDLGNTLVNDLVLQRDTITKTGEWLEAESAVTSATSFVEAYQRQLENITFPFLSRTYGERDVFERVFAELGVGSDQVDRVLAGYRRYLDEAVERDPDVASALTMLREEGVLTAIISNERVERVDAYLAKTELETYFDVVVVSERVGAEKPDPAVFQAAVDELSVAATEIAMFGDNPMADGACKELGMTYVEVTGYKDKRWFWERGDFYLPDISIERVSPANVRHVLDMLSAKV